MSDKKTQLEDVVSLAKRRGFIYQGSEVYGGLSGTWDYGPLGVTLKRNIMQLWWKTFVESREDMYGVDAAILMNQKVWQASGHTKTFADPLAECENCRSRFRLDHLPGFDKYHESLQKLSDQLAESDENDATAVAKMMELEGAMLRTGGFTQRFLNENIKCPTCGAKGRWAQPRYFNMMFETRVGTMDESESISYLRPETAQGIFTNYKNVIDSFYPDLPFGIAQMGKAFRNEISPRDFVFRAREFEQMEVEYFVHPDKWEEAFEQWRKDVWEFLEQLGLPKDMVHEFEVPQDELAHYSKRTIDFEFDFPHDKDELLGLAYRTDFDLKNIHEATGKSMDYTIKGTTERFIPHVIEPSFGVERALMAVLTSAYTEDEIGGEKRIFLKLPEHLAPVKYAVSPLLKNKPELVEKAREVYKILKKKHGAVMWDDNGNIGKRYRRQDEIGTPHCITIDFQTLDDDTVTIRDRDTAEQQRVSIDKLTTEVAA